MAHRTLCFSYDDIVTEKHTIFGTFCIGGNEFYNLQTYKFWLIFL